MSAPAPAPPATVVSGEPKGPRSPCNPGQRIYYTRKVPAAGPVLSAPMVTVAPLLAHKQLCAAGAGVGPPPCVSSRAPSVGRSQSSPPRSASRSPTRQQQARVIRSARFSSPPPQATRVVTVVGPPTWPQAARLASPVKTSEPVVACSVSPPRARAGGCVAGGCVRFATSIQPQRVRRYTVGPVMTPMGSAACAGGDLVVAPVASGGCMARERSPLSTPRMPLRLNESNTSEGSWKANRLGASIRDPSPGTSAGPMHSKENRMTNAKEGNILVPAQRRCPSQGPRCSVSLATVSEADESQSMVNSSTNASTPEAPGSSRLGNVGSMEEQSSCGETQMRLAQAEREVLADLARTSGSSVAMVIKLKTEKDALVVELQDYKSKLAKSLAQCKVLAEHLQEVESDLRKALGGKRHGHAKGQQRVKLPGGNHSKTSGLLYHVESATARALAAIASATDRSTESDGPSTRDELMHAVRSRPDEASIMMDGAGAPPPIATNSS